MFNYFKKTMKIEDLQNYCQRKGLVFQTSEIYGGYSGFFDYGPVGVEIIRNIKNEWWNRFINLSKNIVGIDGSIITHPKVWEASGHIQNFNDPLVECKKCKKRFRADHIVEDKLLISAEGLSNEELDAKIINNKIVCPNCKGKLSNVRTFNQMLSTEIGAVKGNISYLRPETCQSIFVSYKQVMDTNRLKPPFGIGQIGKAFRNEIRPRNFIFRVREFEQMEIEYFVLEKEKNNCEFFDKIKKNKINILSEDMQKKGENISKDFTFQEAVEKKIFNSTWFAYWVNEFYNWYISLGVKKENLRIRQHLKTELSHYSGGTIDIEYKFDFGWKEIQGIADRQKYDLTQHQKYSKTNLEYFDPITKKRELLYVCAEPSVGVSRLFLMLLNEGIKEEKERTVLKIVPRLASYKVAIFPLLKKKKELVDLSKEIFTELSKNFKCYYDESGSIGRRYRRQDEVGTPFCITVDFDSLEDKTVTVRERDSMKQVRVKIKELYNIILKKIKN